MDPTRLRRTPSGRLAWLLWLVLLVPLAQTVAIGHGLSHLQAERSAGGEGKQAPHGLHCDICVTAAALGGGALLGQPQRLPEAAARHARPLLTRRAVWLALPTPGYLSRAPPARAR